MATVDDGGDGRGSVTMSVAVEAARETFQAARWGQAYSAGSAVGLEVSGVDDLERLAISAHLTGEYSTSLKAWRRAHTRRLVAQLEKLGHTVVLHDAGARVDVGGHAAIARVEPPEALCWDVAARSCSARARASCHAPGTAQKVQAM